MRLDRRQLALLAGLAPVCHALGTAGAATSSSGPDLWRFGVERRYGPFIDQDSQGRNFGLSYDLLTLIKPHLPARILELAPAPLPELIQGIVQGHVDFISSVRPTPERGRWLGFTRPYVKVPSVLVTRRGPPWQHEMDLLARSRAKVAVGRGYAVALHLRQHWPALDLQELDDDSQCLLALRAGRVAGWVPDMASAHFLMQGAAPDEMVIKADLGFEYDLCFAFSKDRPQTSHCSRVPAIQPPSAAAAMTARRIAPRFRPDPAVSASALERPKARQLQMAATKAPSRAAAGARMNTSPIAAAPSRCDTSKTSKAIRPRPMAAR